MSSNYSKQEITDKIKAEAKRLGFSACGIASAKPVSVNHQTYFKDWLQSGHAADMTYLENNLEKRLNPQLLCEGTQSIISVALNYYPEQKQQTNTYQISWYAYGKDYHLVMKERLLQLFNYIHQELTPIQGRIFCDTAPVLERYWAWKAGLGWIGKNNQFIIPYQGSCFFLGELFIDIELLYDEPQKERCGNCTKCLDSCPTKALFAPYHLDSRRCLSYLTIENRGEIPEEYHTALNNRIYGCDECQKSCPWNRQATPTSIKEFNPSSALLALQKRDWNLLDELQYQTLFHKSAVKRAKYNGLLRNIRVAQKNNTEEEQQKHI